METNQANINEGPKPSDEGNHPSEEEIGAQTEGVSKTSVEKLQDTQTQDEEEKHEKEPDNQLESAENSSEKAGNDRPEDLESKNKSPISSQTPVSVKITGNHHQQGKSLVKVTPFKEPANSTSPLLQDKSSTINFAGGSQLKSIQKSSKGSTKRQLIENVSPNSKPKNEEKENTNASKRMLTRSSKKNTRGETRDDKTNQSYQLSNEVSQKLKESAKKSLQAIIENRLISGNSGEFNQEPGLD